MFGLSRLGLSARLVAIVVLALFSLIALSAGLAFVADDRAAENRISLPEKVAAVVALLNTTPVAKRELVVQALRSERLSLALRDSMPEMTGLLVRKPGAEWMVRQYLDKPDQAVVRVAKKGVPDRGAVRRWIDDHATASATPLLVVVKLADGSFVEFDTPGSVGRHMLGLPPGFFIGLIGSILAVIAVRAVMREARPLKALLVSVSGFSTDAQPREVEATGAPDLKNLIEATNSMQERIAQLLRGRTILLGAISHDLRTYLTRLRLRVEKIGNDDMRERAVQDLEGMAELIDDALTLTKGTADKGQTSVVDVVEIVHAEVDARESRSVDVKIDGEGRTSVRAAAVALRRLVNNLIDNALRYGQRAEVGIHREDGFVVMCVDDDGPGIPADQNAMIFEPFVRLETSRNRETGGSGLGLAICKQIVEAAGGTISVAKSPLGGARFAVRLPVS